MMKSRGSSKRRTSPVLQQSTAGFCCSFFIHWSIVILYREKKLLVSSEDYGRDLTGVQNLRKKHKRLEAELGAHDPAIQVTES